MCDYYGDEYLEGDEKDSEEEEHDYDRGLDYLVNNAYNDYGYDDGCDTDDNSLDNDEDQFYDRDDNFSYNVDANESEDSDDSDDDDDSQDDIVVEPIIDYTADANESEDSDDSDDDDDSQDDIVVEPIIDYTADANESEDSDDSDDDDDSQDYIDVEPIIDYTADANESEVSDDSDDDDDSQDYIDVEPIIDYTADANESEDSDDSDDDDDSQDDIVVEPIIDYTADANESEDSDDSQDYIDVESIIQKKSGNRKRTRKSKETFRKSKKQKIESTSRVSQKIKKKLRKNKEFSDKNKNSSNKNKKKRPHVKISPGAIRKFSASYVRIPQSRMKWARKMVNTHIEFIRKYCKKHAEEIFSHFEFTGSFYEHLKTEEANELDILVVLDTKNKADLVEEKVNDVPGYTLIKVTKRSSKYWQFVDDKQQGYVDPTKVRNWFFGQVQKAVNQYDKDKKDKEPELTLYGNGPATKLLIDDKKTDDKKNHGKLEVDLVPAFLFKPKKDRSSTAPVAPVKGRRYVAKPPEEIKADGFKYPREMLWRQSFSFEEKKKMEKMDAKDKGCRHEIVRVIKTIRNKDGTPLNLLSSYHVKTAFLHYNFDEGQENLEWSGKHLPVRFLELMDYLRQRISEKRLSHFFINELNLLDEFSHPALNHIENRLSELISNEKKLKKVLMQGERSKMFRKVSAKR